MSRALTVPDRAEIRATLARHNPYIGAGYTWDTIERLLDTVDALQAQLDVHATIDALLSSAPDPEHT